MSLVLHPLPSPPAAVGDGEDFGKKKKKKSKDKGEDAAEGEEGGGALLRNLTAHS
jgi:hypothetical protein